MAVLKVVILAILLVACSTTSAIVQDKPQPGQCFDGPFNPFRLNTEKWIPLASDGNALFVLKNPNPGGFPQAIVIVVMNGGIVRYGYLDGQNFRSFMFEGECFKEEVLSPELSEDMKQLVLKLLKEIQC